MTRPLWRPTLAICSMWLLLGASACRWGMTPGRLPAANGPQGVQVAVRVRGEPTDRVGELFAADTIGIVVRAGQLQRVAWGRIHAIDVAGFGVPYDLAPGMAADASVRARLALLSRYPQGMEPGILARVLEVLGQAALVEVGMAANGGGNRP